MATFGTFTAGQVLTAAELNTAGAWQDYTPSWTQSATISKTINFARYTQLGKTVQGSLKMTATSSGTSNNKILIGLPVNMSASNAVIGTMYVFDSSQANNQYRFGVSLALYDSATTMAFTPRNSDGAPAAAADTDVRFGQNYNSGGGAVTGFTVASGDIIYVQFMYEAS